MVTWDDAVTTMQDLASDTNTATLTFLKRMANIGYKLVLAELGRPVTEKTDTSITTTASTQYYDLPMDCLFPKTVKVTSGSIAYPVYEIESQETWDEINLQSTVTADVPEWFFLRLNYGVGGSEIGFHPIPSTTDNTVTIVYEVADKDKTADVYATGTVTLTNASKTVLGNGTTFTAAMVGRYVKGNDGYYYRIASFTDTTHVTLDHNYTGITTAGVTTAIYEMFQLPEEMQILPAYYALAHYYGMKQNPTQEAKYIGFYNASLESGKLRWGTKSRSAIIRSNRWGSKWGAWAPGFFPTTMT